MSTATVPLEQHLTDADREAGLALINHCLVGFAAGMRAASDVELLHEAERLECQHKSPVVTTMRSIVDAERARRLEAVTS